MNFYWLVLGVLAVWRITHLLNAEDGPWDLLVKFRQFVGDGFFGSLIDCFYCLSVWVSAPFAYVIGGSVREDLLLWPALSGAAILLERLSSKAKEPAPTIYFEEEES